LKEIKLTFQNNEFAAGLQRNTADGNAIGLTYKLHTECRYDCGHICGVLYPWLLSWKEISGPQIGDINTLDKVISSKSMAWTARTELQFSLRRNAPSLNEVRWLIGKLPDCQVAAESLNTYELYTGARIETEQLEKHLAIPSRLFINMAMRSLMQFQERSESIAAQAIQTWQVLSLVDVPSTNYR
jgi:hypothetical protein